MDKRRNISSGAKWEDIFGYSRAVRVGNVIEVSGTTAVDENSEVVGRGDMYEQARYALGKIERAIREAGGRLEDVVRTRVYLADMDMFDQAAKAHREFFGEIKPASSAIKAILVQEELLVEIEATAIVMEREMET
ncbi:MAG: RidA family protein [Anaerolineae bacterium]|nr:RidA family protein [Anaerolineae bacterium]